MEMDVTDQPGHEQLHDAVVRIREAIGGLVVGQRQAVDLLLTALLSDGHILIEGVPGVAKTLMAKLMARAVDVPFSRLQFTPDLMPSDVLGTSVFNPKELAFEFRPGPIFSSIVLIDEINRAPAKTQAALFEVMEERQVTIDGRTYRMQEPFLVLATQNPIEQEGTYRLPEAQLDRFLFKIHMGYPTPEEEVEILQRQLVQRSSDQLPDVSPVLTAAELTRYRSVVRNIRVEPRLLGYIAALIGETRQHAALYLGASPRASLSVMNAAKAMAGLQGRDFVVPEDIVEVLPHVLRHRLMLTPEKEMEGLTTDDLIRKIIEKVEVPR